MSGTVARIARAAIAAAAACAATAVCAAGMAPALGSPEFLVCLVESALVPVPAGSFAMGNGNGKPDALPVHRIEISTSFLMLRHEVTFEEYDLYCAIAARPPPKDQGWGRGRRPAIHVSWRDAIRFCNFLSEAAGLEPCYDAAGSTCDFEAGGYRLPTEAEWEYAARGGPADSPLLYAGSDDPAATAWFGSEAATRETETKKPNELGLFDMSGNVWEWCWDFYRADYYASSPPKDPRGPALAEVDARYGAEKVRRGGNYHEAERFSAVGYRSKDLPKQADSGMGFRILRKAPDARPRG